MTFNVAKVREDFPILKGDLVYLDNAATTQRPKAVVDALVSYYTKMNANVHRGVYKLSQEATDAYEATRLKLATFLNAKNSSEIIFTKGTTDGVNLVAATWGQTNIQAGDVIAVTRMEHHSNFVPWQQLAKRKYAKFEIIELLPDARLDPVDVKRVLDLKPKLLAVTAASNVTGVVNDIDSLSQQFKSVGTTIFVDAAQAVAHQKIDVQFWKNVDFIAFSSHKMYGPTGTGVLWGREELLNAMPPYQFGGNMILQVRDQETIWNEIPNKFEAGTGDIAGVIGLGSAVDYLQKIGMGEIESREHSITVRALERLKAIPNLKIFGPLNSENRNAIFSFAIPGVHAHDLATFLDMRSIAVRAGHHCAHPFMEKIGAPATCRASFSFYNTDEEINYLCEALEKSQDFFKRKGKGGNHVLP